MTKTILILGGYGNFGKRICETLAQVDNVRLLIAGRDKVKAEALCNQLREKKSAASFQAVALDIFSESFPAQLAGLKPFLVIHTSGPFQGQDYRVPQACIDAGSHYIDLADDRRFVCDIAKLDAQAKAKNLLVVSGASSVPGLASTVIDFFVHQFSRIDSIDIAIAPGNRAERGAATVKAILSYTGHKIPVFENGEWIYKFGWMSPRKLDFGPELGARWLANVDVPDLELFPARYAPVQTVHFQAGLELGLLHWGMVSMAWLTKIGLVKNWAPLVKPIVAASNWFINLGTDTGGMMIKMNGTNTTGADQEIVWRLTAKDGVGPYIPTLSAIILAKQLITDLPFTAGAMPCLGLYSLDAFSEHAQRWNIYHQTFINGTLVKDAEQING
ncbi:MAG TPA: saccharopine dehydrogenase NADP-binding domain-containing protein [Cellvibrio sp.]